MRKSHASLQGELKTSHQKISDLEGQLNKWEADYNSLKTKSEADYKNLKAKSEADLTAARAKFDGLQNDYNTLKAQLEADITAKAEQNTYEISRKLLVENDKVFIVRDTVLDLVTVEPIFFKENTAVVKGLELLPIKLSIIALLTTIV